MKQLFILFVTALLGFLLVFVYAKFAAPNQIAQKSLILSPTPTQQFSLDDAPRESLTGQIATLSGEVLWQSRTATETAKLSTRQLHQGETLETSDNGRVSFSFPNLGTVSLMPKTKLEIVQTLPVNLVFTQNYGTVTYTKSGKLPLSVRTQHLLLIPKTGTMTITTNQQTATVRVMMASGSAQVAYDDSENATQSFILNPEETLVYDDDSREVTTF